MYDSYMKSIVYPVTLPEDLYGEIQEAGRQTRLSAADVLRQSLILGLPKLREKFGAQRVTNVEPLSERAARELYSHREDDSESIRRFIQAQPKDAE